MDFNVFEVFPICLQEKIANILNMPSADDRLKAQLRYALRISETNQGEYDVLLHEVCDQLQEKLNQTGFIDQAITDWFEAYMAPMAEVAKSYRLHMVAHAHIDMNWQWGYQETVHVTLDTFRTMLRLMEEYPEFIYSQSQASTYKICEEHDPELFEAIRKRIQEGRWEVTASTWTETDKNLPSGESLVRHYLYTKQYVKKKFGLRDDQLQLDFQPDTFGHSAFVPEIAQSCGVKYYYHCRGKEMELAYRFRAPSGATVLCYQDPYFYNGVMDWFYFENVPSMCQKTGGKSAVRLYGVGDHGGGPSRRDIEMIRAMQQWPIAPTIVFSGLNDFFKELEQVQEKLPIIDTERNYIFTGCYSSQSEIKGGNRLCEDRLYIGETLSALASGFAQGKGNQNNYFKAWEKVMFNQFHDILPGSCMRDGRHYAMGLYQESLALSGSGLTAGMLALAESIDSSAFIEQGNEMTTSEGSGVGYGSSLSEFAFHTAAEYGKGKTRVLHVFNPTAFEREEVTYLTIWDWNGDSARLTCQTVDGQSIPFVNKGTTGYWGHNKLTFGVFVTVPAYGVTTVVVKEGELTSLPLRNGEIPNENHRVEYVRPLVMENSKLRAEFDKDMCLISLVDKANGQELIRDKAAYFEYYAESSRIHMPNAWSEGPAVRVENINQVSKTYIADKGIGTALDQTIEYDLEYGDTRLHVAVTLTEDSPLLQFRVNTDWRENGFHGQEIPTLRFRVPLNYDAPLAYYDIPMGITKREAFPHDVPARSFAFAPNGDQNGVAVLCDTQGAYRNENNTLSVTLLRATSIPDHLPEFGMHYHRVAIGVLPCDKKQLHQVGQVFIHPLPYASVCPHKGTFPCEGQWMNVDGNVIVSGVKMPEESNGKEVILRLYSLSDEEQTVSLTMHQPIETAILVNGLEQPLSQLKPNGNTVNWQVSPLAVSTICVKLS
ncbi:MAG: alpha-mannosidase [Clostridia bacterium]|nr:alpha-mannosidase [Clostridia bacterium]